jgi:hypothetical protein
MTPRHAQNILIALDGVDLHAVVTGGAHAGAYGSNDLRLPTQSQAQAGVYKMGRTSVQGLRIAIEQPQGSVRVGKDAKGKEWSSRMAAHYGYLEGTRGADGDGIDCFVGPFPESEAVFVVNQRGKGCGFDEHKVMLGFASERHARGAYLDSYERGWAGISSIVPMSINQFRWWLKHGNKFVALDAESLPLEAGKPMTKKIYWTDAQPDGINYDQILYELRRMDGPDGLLLDGVSMAEIMEDADGVIALDALIVENAQLSRMSERLRAIMDRSGGAVKVPAVQVSDPFRARGVTNIAMIFELSDGQTVSIFFHNPDTTPNKLAPADEMISWKWLLNKKDITIVVAPEKGQDLSPRLVAQRIMRLAEKNSSAFQKANIKRAERMINIEAIRARIAEKEVALNELAAQIEVARLEKDQRSTAAEDVERKLPDGWAYATHTNSVIENRDPNVGGAIVAHRNAEMKTVWTASFMASKAVSYAAKKAVEEVEFDTPQKAIAAIEAAVAASEVAESEYPPAPDGWTLEDGPGGEWVTYRKNGTRGTFYTSKSTAARGEFVIVTPDNKTHSRMYPRSGWDSSRGGYVSWEDAFRSANEVAAQFSPATNESAPPDEVYAFKNASDEALSLLRIGAQNPAARSTYKTAVSVEQSADAHGMAIRWEAVSTLPTFDDATGGLFGDGDQGHIRGELTYNGTKLAQVYVREDGMAAFDYDKGLPEALGGAFDQFEDDYTGWNDSWDDVIYKLRNERGLRLKEPMAWEILIESLKKSGFTQQDECDFVGGDGLQDVAIQVIPKKQSEASLMYWAGGDKDEDNWKYADNIGELDGEIRADQKFDDDFSEDEMQPIITEMLADAKTLQAWVEGEREKVKQERARKKQGKNPAPTPEPTVTPAPAPEPVNTDANAEDQSEEAEFKRLVNGLSDENLRQIAAKFVFSWRSLDRPALIKELIENSYSIGQRLTTLKSMADSSGGPIRTDRRRGDAPQAKFGWKILDDGGMSKKVPGYSSIQSAKIAINKNPEWKAANPEVVPFQYQDSGIGDKVVTRYVIVAKDRPVAKVDPAPAANTEDRAFFMSVIDGTHPDLLEPGLSSLIEAAYTRNAADVEMVSLFSQAVNAYTQAMLSATAGV